MSGAALVVLGGLPATGKSTVARHFARAAGAVHLRIDTIEQGIRDAGLAGTEIGPAGYVVAHGIAADNLALGRVVVADSVNALALTRQGWRDVARRAGVPTLEAEIVCSDREQHRHRADSREPGVPGLALPDWQAIQARHYEAWPEADLTLDTARLTPDGAAAALAEALARKTAAGSADL